MKKNNEQSQKKFLIFCIIILIAIDQITKVIMFRQDSIIKNIDDNSSNGYYIVLSMIILFSIIRYITSKNSFIKFDTRLVLSFAIAGLIGNVIDRIWLGRVINFIKLSDLININLSYIYILIAWIGMAIILTKNSMKILRDRKIEKGIKDEYKKNNSK